MKYKCAYCKKSINDLEGSKEYNGERYHFLCWLIQYDTLKKQSKLGK